MRGKVSIILFGISFLVAVLGEAFILNVSSPHLFSILGIGIVVILTGYLFFVSIWEHIASNNRKKELLWEDIRRQDEDKWNSRYTELSNIQKATYTALKKSELKIEEQIKELSDRLTQIIQLQNKQIDGQMKALNISVNYSKEHTKELIEAIKQEGIQKDSIEPVGTIESHENKSTESFEDNGD